MKNNFSIEPFPGPATHEIASVVATSMLHNPIHLAVYRSSDEKAWSVQYHIFRQILSYPECNLVVARQEDRIIGVMNYYLPGKCQLSPMQTIALIPGLLAKLRLKLPRLLKWKKNWGTHDPKTPHYHLGPLAILPEMQGQGVGSALLQHFCQLVDAQGAVAYLETDKEENVTLYKRFGFEVVQTDRLLGVKNWFMVRNPRG